MWEWLCHQRWTVRIRHNGRCLGSDELCRKEDEIRVNTEISSSRLAESFFGNAAVAADQHVGKQQVLTRSFVLCHRLPLRMYSAARSAMATQDVSRRAWTVRSWQTLAKCRPRFCILLQIQS